MADYTAISWTDKTFNPWMGCTRVSPGCEHCYAATLMDERYGRVKWGAGEKRLRTSEANWKKPLAWDREAKAAGRRFRVFCASLADVFDNEVPDQWRTDLWALIAATSNLDWQILTKRIGNVTYPMPHNVWLGITVVNQEEADRDIPKLLRIDAPVRWLSCEPLLGPIDLDEFHPFRAHRYCDNVLKMARGILNGGIEWVIVGGESGAGARPMDPAWARSLRDQCAVASVPFHFKQWGGARPKSNGHLLDGIEHRAFPVSV